MDRNRILNYNTVMQIRISTQLKNKVAIKAKQEGKTVSDFIRELLEEQCENI